MRERIYFIWQIKYHNKSSQVLHNPNQIWKRWTKKKMEHNNVCAFKTFYPFFACYVRCYSIVWEFLHQNKRKSFLWFRIYTSVWICSNLLFEQQCILGFLHNFLRYCKMPTKNTRSSIFRSCCRSSLSLSLSLFHSICWLSFNPYFMWHKLWNLKFLNLPKKFHIQENCVSILCRFKKFAKTQRDKFSARRMWQRQNGRNQTEQTESTTDRERDWEQKTHGKVNCITISCYSIRCARVYVCWAHRSHCECVCVCVCFTMNPLWLCMCFHLGLSKEKPRLKLPHQFNR